MLQTVEVILLHKNKELILKIEWQNFKISGM